MQMSGFPTVLIWVTRKYSLRQLNNLLHIKQFDHYLHVGGVGRATFTSPVAIAFNRNLRRWHRTALETRWQDDKMTTQDCPGNKACDPFALKFMSYCCSYISIDWLTDSENLLPTLNHTFKSWSRDFSWWRKNYCFFVEPVHPYIPTSKLFFQVACNVYFRQRSAHSRPSPYSTRVSRLLGS